MEKRTNDYFGGKVSTHSRLKAAGRARPFSRAVEDVSTHSRLKAAGARGQSPGFQIRCFNTQPPKGGWNTNQ